MEVFTMLSGRMVAPVAMVLALLFASALAHADIAEPFPTDTGSAPTDTGVDSDTGEEKEDSGASLADASADENVKSDSSCSFVLKQNPSLEAQLLLGGALVGIGLWIRRRSRR